MQQNIIPIFFAADDNYVPFLGVAIGSLLTNASQDYHYQIHVLTEGLKEENMTRLKRLENPNCQIDFVDLTPQIAKVKDLLNATLRDYYTASIFYRVFIPALYPQYHKAIYLDCDLVVLDDIAKFYQIEMGNNILVGCNDDIISSCDEFRTYAKDAIGVPEEEYINSGVLLINLDEFRKQKVYERMIMMMQTYHFETVAPDQDYLNVLCRGKVMKVEKGWDKMSLDENYDGPLHIIHYNNFRKPWYFDDVPYGRYFWQYAQGNEFYEDIIQIKKSFTPAMADEKAQGGVKLVESALRIIASDHNFNKVLNEK